MLRTENNVRNAMHISFNFVTLTSASVNDVQTVMTHVVSTHLVFIPA